MARSTTVGRARPPGSDTAARPRGRPEPVPDAVHALLPVVGAGVVASDPIRQHGPDRRPAAGDRDRRATSDHARAADPAVTIRRRRPSSQSRPSCSGPAVVAARSNSVRSAGRHRYPPAAEVDLAGPQALTVGDDRRPGGADGQPVTSSGPASSCRSSEAPEHPGATVRQDRPLPGRQHEPPGPTDCQVGCDAAQPVDALTEPGAAARQATSRSNLIGGETPARRAAGDVTSPCWRRPTLVERRIWRHPARDMPRGCDID